MHAETMSRAAFELVSEAIGELDLYRESRDRNHLFVARSKLDDALRQDRLYVNAVFYSGVVNDLIGHIGDAIQSFRSILAEGVEGAPVVLEQVRYNLAVSLYHRYSRKYLEEAEVEFLAVLETTEDPLLRCLARAGLAQTYAMWEIPPNPDVRDAREDRLLEDLFRKSQEFSELTLAQLEELEEIPEALRRQIQATSLNAQGMAVMYYTDYRGEDRAKRLREALTKLRKADRLFPLDWANTCDLGSCQMRLGYWDNSVIDFEECRKHLGQVVKELRPEYGFALYEIGRSYRIEGRFPEALDYLKRARDIDKAVRDVGDTRVNREIQLAESESARYP